jgi:hypothetical protein
MMTVGEAPMTWCSGYGGSQMETWLSGGMVGIIEMTFL